MFPDASLRAAFSLHDALPISPGRAQLRHVPYGDGSRVTHQPAPNRPGNARASDGLEGVCELPDRVRQGSSLDRKSIRLNSSHGYISIAVSCWKKKNDFSLINS